MHQPKPIPMKNTLFMAIIMAFLYSCGGAPKEYNVVVEVIPDDVQKFIYSASFKPTNWAIYDVCRKFMDALESGDLAAVESTFADSVSLYLADGSVFDSTKDSIMVIAAGYMDMAQNLNITHHAGMSMRSTDMKHDWALAWITESYTTPEGVEEQIAFQENYLIESGKIRTIRQYALTLPAGVVIEDSPDSEFTYSGSFEKADESLREPVLGWNNAISTPTDFDEAAQYLADSVTIYLMDGSMFNASKDSIMSLVNVMLGDFTSIDVQFDAITTVHSKDQNQDWVLSWTNETMVNAAGEEENVLVHEDYLIEDGKIRMVRQFGMKTSPE